MKKFYMAPMEGVTNYVFRNAYHQFFHPMDKYFTPFISAKPNKKLSNKEIREVSPETNQGLYIVPQILTNNADDFLQTAAILMEYGHKEINLNLGCPSGTVTAKGKGSGFLAEPVKLERFLEQIYRADLDLAISIKTRVGTDYEDDWEQILEIYNKFPVSELIVHPRIQKDYYKFTPRLEAYQLAVECSKAPLCYNGDLFSQNAYDSVCERFIDTNTFMFGRGVVAKPWLLDMICDEKRPDKTVLRAFHDRIYQDYRVILSGDRNVLFRMKELWNYMITSFTNHEKYAKKIKKAQKCSEYEAIISSLFAEQELIP